MAALPERFQTIVIPVANPHTAPNLLRLAGALVDEGGRVLAVMVTLSGSEKQRTSIEDMQEVIDKFCEEDCPVEFITVQAPSVSRGILDEVREQQADLLILGVQRPTRGEVEIGSIAENVVATAPCDVLLYRDVPRSEFKRVVVWTNGTRAARIASQIGLVLGQNFETSVECMLVQGNDRSYWQGIGRIEESLNGLLGKERAKRTVITAEQLVPGLLSRVSKEDLLVVGFSRRTQLEKWLFGDFVHQLLRRAPGPVILVARSSEITAEKRLWQRLNWAMPRVTPAEQDELVRQAREMASPSLDYLILILISAVIASLGLLLNSAAVIIGAMLIAPLMQPLTAFSTGMTTGRLGLIQRALLTLVIGAGFGITVSALLGWLLPLDIPTAEMQARGNPTLVDAGVAFAAGFIGAYANARRGIPAALAGVAIAAALMPPLCTVGLGLAFGETDLAFGALLLFLTNIGLIILAGWAVYFWLGVRPRRNASLAVLVALMIPVLYMLYNLSTQAGDSRIVKQELQKIFPSDEVTQVEMHTENSPLRVVATLRAVREPQQLDVLKAELILEEELGRDIDLEIVVERVVKSQQEGGQ